MLNEIFQKQYDFEIDQRNSLASAVNVPIIAITVLSSALSVALLDFPYKQGLLSAGFLVLATATLAALAYAVYSAVRSFWGYDYQKLPGAHQLQAHAEALRQWHVSEGKTGSALEAATAQDVRDFLNQRLADAIDCNSANNLARGDFLHRATATIAIAVALFIPSAIVYAFAKATAEDKIHQVRLLAPQPAPTMTTNGPAPASSPTTAQPPASPTSAPVAPRPKPTGPLNTSFRSGALPSTPTTPSAPSASDPTPHDKK